MSVTFHENNEKINKLEINSNSSNPPNRFKRTMAKLLSKKYNPFENIKRNIMSKEELNKYFKYSEKLRRRNSIESSKIHKKIKPNYFRTNSLKFKTKVKKGLKINKPKRFRFKEITAERIYQNLCEGNSLENNEERVKFLFKLNPFFEKLSEIEKNSETIIRTISPEYRGDMIPGNKVIFRYGEEINDFYLIHKGKVNLYFPFTESLYMNIDEYYIYLMRLRRYGEIEMLNNILLMNNNAFLKEIEDPFNFDDYIVKLYNTFIKIKFTPVFLNQKDNKINTNAYINNYQKKVYINENEFNDNDYATFNDKEIKNLVIRIEHELIETIKWIRPEELRQVTKEEIDGESIKKIVKIPEYLVEKFKLLNPDEINNNTDYLSRIEPVKIFNTNIQRQKITIMRYLYLRTISTGEYFGEFTNDSSCFFHSKLLNTMKHTKLNLKLHKYSYFYNYSAVSIKGNNDDYSGYLYLGLIEKGLYIQYFRKFIEKVNSNKKKFLLNNKLFKK